VGEGGAHPRVAGLAAGLAVQRCGDRHKRPEVQAAALNRRSPAPAFFDALAGRTHRFRSDHPC
jgi:hypothetical protein